MRRAAALLGAALTCLLAAGCGGAAGDDVGELVLRADFAAARALDPSLAATDDQQLLSQAETILRARLDLAPCADEVLGVERTADTLTLRVRGDLTDEPARSLQRLLTGAGRVSIHLVATATDLDLDAEGERLAAWRAANPEAALADFVRLAPDAGGPDARLLWASRRGEPLALLRPEEGVPGFAEDELKSVSAEPDLPGGGGLALTFTDATELAFEAFTTAHVGRELAVLLDGQVRTVATLAEPLRGPVVVAGPFEPGELEVLELLLLRPGLPVPLELVESRIPATGR
ncbi:MAG: hypothetical protein AAF682_30500 [Planctomycetota bacterium]